MKDEHETFAAADEVCGYEEKDDWVWAVVWRLAIVFVMAIAAGLAFGAPPPQIANHTIEIMPQPCPGGTMCNTYHVLSMRADGSIEFEHDFPSDTMSSKVMIILRTPKRDVFIWSDR